MVAHIVWKNSSHNLTGGKVVSLIPLTDDSETPQLSAVAICVTVRGSKKRDDEINKLCEGNFELVVRRVN